MMEAADLSASGSVDADAVEGALGLAWLSQWGCSPLLRLLGRESPNEVWRASRARLMRWGVAPAVISRFQIKKRAFSFEAASSLVEKAGLDFVPYGSRYFPVGLTHLTYPPAGLFVGGTKTALARLQQVPRIAVVGTRRATAYGIRATQLFTQAFACRDIAVISGMAFGIDGRAHEVALDSGGLTVAVLGCGADVVYPRRHRHLHERITSKGVVMSELPPGCPPARWTFPHRNRLLAALTDAVLVIEGTKSSGAMQTANWALDLGRPVFAVPGPIETNSCEGCNALLYDGASPALDPDITVEEFLLVTGIERGERLACDSGRERGDLRGVEYAPGSGERRVMQCLAMGPCSTDSLVIQIGLPAREVMGLLARLELAGLVRRSGPGMFIRAP